MRQVLCSWQLFAAVVSTVFFSGVTILLFQHIVLSSGEMLRDGSSGPSNTQFQLISRIVAPQLYTEPQILPATASTTPFSVTLVGDIMLARSVELWMQGSGIAYPFLHVQDIIGSSTVSFANFEAAIPENHEHTVAYSTRFSTDAKYITELAKSGITHVSLANNHAHDFGGTAEANTRIVLAGNGVIPFGNANTVSTTSVTYVHSGSTTVSFIAIQNVYGALDYDEIKKIIIQMNETSDIQIAYIHWGTEYQPTHDLEQEVLAKHLVSLGIDAIVGHHPHVVEDIQMVQGVPVFYSLGNFIFDQYFSTAVQQGLALRLEYTNRALTFTLVPVTSIGTHAQPRLMEGTERSLFLEKLSERSDKSLTAGIISGGFSVPILLQNR